MKTRRLLNVEVDDEYDDFLLSLRYGDKKQLVNNFLKHILLLSGRLEEDFVRCAAVNGQYQIILMTEKVTYETF